MSHPCRDHAPLPPWPCILPVNGIPPKQPPCKLLPRITQFTSRIHVNKSTTRFSAADMVRMKNHEKSGWVNLIWNPGQVLTSGCGETSGRARTFISDQSKEVSQDRERRRKLHRCIQTAIYSARRDWRLFFQTFQPSFVISWPISTNEPSLESLKSQQSDGAIFVTVSPRKRTIAPFLRRVLTLSAQFPRIRTCSGQINLYRGEIAVVHENKSRQLHTMGSVKAEVEVRHRWRTCHSLFRSYAHMYMHSPLNTCMLARSWSSIFFYWHSGLGLRFAWTCSWKYSVQRWAQRWRRNVVPFLVQTDVGSDDKLRIMPWQHSKQNDQELPTPVLMNCSHVLLM